MTWQLFKIANGWHFDRNCSLCLLPRWNLYYICLSVLRVWKGICKALATTYVLHSLVYNLLMHQFIVSKRIRSRIIDGVSEEKNYLDIMMSLVQTLFLGIQLQVIKLQTNKMTSLTTKGVLYFLLLSVYVTRQL